MADWLLVAPLFVCPLVVADDTAVYWERVREFLRLLLRGALMMPLRFLRSITGESVLQLLRSWSSVRLPSDSPLDMFQSVRAWVGGEGGEGAGGERGGGAKTFSRPVLRPGESCASPQRTNQPVDNRRARAFWPHYSSALIHVLPCAIWKLNTGEKRGKLHIGSTQR